jgi:hypothetical protein
VIPGYPPAIHRTIHGRSRSEAAPMAAARHFSTIHSPDVDYDGGFLFLFP